MGSLNVHCFTLYQNPENGVQKDLELTGNITHSHMRRHTRTHATMYPHKTHVTHITCEMSNYVLSSLFVKPTLARTQFVEIVKVAISLCVCCKVYDYLDGCENLWMVVKICK